MHGDALIIYHRHRSDCWIKFIKKREISKMNKNKHVKFIVERETHVTTKN